MAPNTNCLEGFACPECGQTEHFDITSEVIAHVHDSGVEDTDGPCWSAVSGCVCPDCGHDGMVKDFCPSAL